MSLNHSERKHSKFSASGAERWFNCPGSVELSEGLKSKDTEWSKEGVIAHEILEKNLRIYLSGNDGADIAEFDELVGSIPTKWKPREMVEHVSTAAEFITDAHERREGSELLVETRIQLPFIHEEMFGTFDSSVVQHFGLLDVYDFKYGVSPVSPVENLQMIFYGLGLAHLYDWNFKRVRLNIIQPRIRGYDGPLFWELGILELMSYVSVFKKAVKRVEANPETFVEGKWCHWCVAKTKCPLKEENKLRNAKSVFLNNPMKGKDHYGK